MIHVINRCSEGNKVNMTINPCGLSVNVNNDSILDLYVDETILNAIGTVFKKYNTDKWNLDREINTFRIPNKDINGNPITYICRRESTMEDDEFDRIAILDTNNKDTMYYRTSKTGRSVLVDTTELIIMITESKTPDVSGKEGVSPKYYVPKSSFCRQYDATLIVDDNRFTATVFIPFVNKWYRLKKPTWISYKYESDFSDIAYELKTKTINIGSEEAPKLVSTNAIIPITTEQLKSYIGESKIKRKSNPKNFNKFKKPMGERYTNN